MIIELIPVIDIYSNQDVKIPEKGPYWEYPELWNEYNSECLKNAGFIDEFNPYLPGSSFYRISEISEKNLIKLVIEHTKDLKNGKYDREEISSFFGGYVLRVNEQDKYFPQCCGDLSDIHYWENLAKGKDGFYAGHPQPEVKIDHENIMLDFSVNELDECFSPTPKDTLVLLDKTSLKKAIDLVKEELKIFDVKLEKINTNNNLNIENISNLLIWNDQNYK
jgi:hypothetical protein